MEFEYLFVKFDVDGLKLFFDVRSVVVRELGVGERLTGFILCLIEVSGWRPWHRVKRDRLRELIHVLVVTDLIEMHMRNLLRVEVLLEGSVCGYVTRQFREVRCHINLLLRL